MTADPPGFRPKRFPAPEFPPQRTKTFAQTPPAIFPVLLGLLGLTLALRAGLAVLGLPSGIGDLAAGLVVPLWALGVLAYAGKLMQRPGVIHDDLAVMTARGGLAAATMGGMAAAALLAPFAPVGAKGLIVAALALHAVLAVLVVRLLLRLPAEARSVNPAWHMLFVGFIVAGPGAAAVGWEGLARLLLYATIPVALAIWAVSLVQLARRPPPPPLRPMLAIHLAPVALFTLVSAAVGPAWLAAGLPFVLLAGLALLLLRLGWVTEAGLSPLWGAFTFPLAASAGAFLAAGGRWEVAGLAVLAVALGLVPWIAWQVLRQWPRGALAAKTNAAKA